MEMVAFVLCFVALVANFKTAVSSPDTEPPKFTYCPSDIMVETVEPTIQINWKIPKAVDNFDRFPMMTNNLNPGSIIGIGEFLVVYTARDKSENTATCKFKITVKRKVMQCPKLHLPVNGALVCNGGPDFEARFCLAACQSGYDFAIPPGMVYLCAQDGKWVPFGGGKQVPDCSVRRGPSRFQWQYYKGDANDPATQAALKNNLQQLTKTSGLTPFLCQKEFDSCNVQRFIVYPGPRN